MADAKSGSKKKGGMGKILIPMILLVVLGGGFVGAAMMGIVKVPGLTPKNKMKPAAKAEEKKKEEPAVAQSKPKKKEADPPVLPPEPDWNKGAENLAEVWSTLPPDKLLAICDKWKDAKLATVLLKMEPEKVSEILGMMKPERASKLSIEIQKQAGLIAKK